MLIILAETFEGLENVLGEAKKSLGCVCSDFASVHNSGDMRL